MTKIKKIIIFVIIIAVLIFGYFSLTKKTPNDDASLVSSSAPVLGTTDLTINTQGSLTSGDFLTILLNVKSIKLDDAIFSDPAFLTLHDSTIILIPDGTEGRPNPFAPIGFEKTIAPVNLPNTNTTTPNTAPSTDTGVAVPKN